MRYSGLKVITQGLFGNKGWTPAWRDPAPKAEYDAVIIGGGGHGLSTAYYLAKNHGMTNIAVLEKGYLGSGNIGRNTTIVRANYFLPGNSEFYSHSLKLWEGLEADLNYNVMHSQRGLINLFHSDGQRDAFVRRGNAMINQGDDAVLLDRAGVRERLERLDDRAHRRHALVRAVEGDRQPLAQPGNQCGSGTGLAQRHRMDPDEVASPSSTAFKLAKAFTHGDQVAGLSGCAAHQLAPHQRLDQPHQERIQRTDHAGSVTRSQACQTASRSGAKSPPTAS